MTYEIVTTTTYTKAVVAEFATLDAAVNFAHQTFVIVDFEHDAANDAADFYTADGVVYAINPKR